MNERFLNDMTGDARVEQVLEKHETFLKVTLNMLCEHLTKQQVNFKKLSSGDKNKILNEFLLLHYPESQSDFRTKLKTELLKML